MDGMHETFEHTADLGLRIRAADLDTLFVEAAQALVGMSAANTVHFIERLRRLLRHFL
jgi:SHS2 domain-containing protein